MQPANSASIRGLSSSEGRRTARPLYTPPSTYTWDETKFYDCIKRTHKVAKFRLKTEEKAKYTKDNLKIYFLQAATRDKDCKEPRCTVFNALSGSKDVVRYVGNHVPFQLVSYDTAATLEVKKLINAPDKLITFGKTFSILVDKTDIDCFLVYEDLKKFHISIHPQYKSYQKLTWFRAVVVEFENYKDLDEFCSYFAKCCSVLRKTENFDRNLQDTEDETNEIKKMEQQEEIQEQVQKKFEKIAKKHQDKMASLTTMYETRIEDLLEDNAKHINDSNMLSRQIGALRTSKDSLAEEVTKLKSEKDDLAQKLKNSEKIVDELKERERARKAVLSTKDDVETEDKLHEERDN